MAPQPKTLVDLQTELQKIATELGVELDKSNIQKFFAASREICWDNRNAFFQLAVIATIITSITTICYFALHAADKYEETKATCHSYNGTMSAIPCVGQNRTDFFQQCCNISAAICESLINDDLDKGCKYGAVAGLTFFGAIILCAAFCFLSGYIGKKQNAYTAITDSSNVALNSTQIAQFNQMMDDIKANISASLNNNTNPSVQKLSRLSETKISTDINTEQFLSLDTLKEIYQAITEVNKLMSVSTVTRLRRFSTNRQLQLENNTAPDNTCMRAFKNCFGGSNV